MFTDPDELLPHHRSLLDIVLVQGSTVGWELSIALMEAAIQATDHHRTALHLVSLPDPPVAPIAPLIMLVLMNWNMDFTIVSAEGANSSPNS